MFLKVATIYIFCFFSAIYNINSYPVAIYKAVDLEQFEKCRKWDRESGERIRGSEVDDADRGNRRVFSVDNLFRDRWALCL